ncbi:MAG: hypothetical protein ACTSRS_05000 [Candidatus Helarchaeota archaeon]
MTINNSASLEVATLKKQVKVIIKKVNLLKAQLQNREITLEEFKKKKEAFENQLREILEQISKYKEKGTVETKKDALIADEAHRLMYEFQTEFPDKMSVAKVYISVSLDDHFIIEIDFSNYPQPPSLTFPSMLQKLFEVPIESKLSILQKWNPQIPPHITEIFYEIERLLIHIFRSEIIEEMDVDKQRINKVLQRRKYLESAQYELELKNYKNAISLFQKVIELSYELEDFEVAKKYAAKIAEVKHLTHHPSP